MAISVLPLGLSLSLSASWLTHVTCEFWLPTLTPHFDWVFIIAKVIISCRLQSAVAAAIQRYGTIWKILYYYTLYVYSNKWDTYAHQERGWQTDSRACLFAAIHKHADAHTHTQREVSGRGPLCWPCTNRKTVRLADGQRDKRTAGRHIKWVMKCWQDILLYTHTHIHAYINHGSSPCGRLLLQALSAYTKLVLLLHQVASNSNSSSSTVELIYLCALPAWLLPSIYCATRDMYILRIRRVEQAGVAENLSYFRAQPEKLCCVLGGELIGFVLDCAILCCSLKEDKKWAEMGVAELEICTLNICMCNCSWIFVVETECCVRRSRTIFDSFI